MNAVDIYVTRVRQKNTYSGYSTWTEISSYVGDTLLEKYGTQRNLRWVKKYLIKNGYIIGKVTNLSKVNNW